MLPRTNAAHRVPQRTDAGAIRRGPGADVAGVVPVQVAADGVPGGVVPSIDRSLEFYRIWSGIQASTSPNFRPSRPPVRGNVHRAGTRHRRGGAFGCQFAVHLL